MGLDGGIKKRMRTKWAPDAFRPVTADLFAQSVHLHDLLTDWTILGKPHLVDQKDQTTGEDTKVKVEATFTHTALAQIFWQFIEHPEALHTVVLLDDRTFVPRQKHATQQKRQEQAERSRVNAGLAEVTAYPHDATFVPEGIRWMQRTQVDADTVECEEIIEPIHMRRLAKSRAHDGVGGSRLWDSFYPTLQARLDALQWPQMVEIVHRSERTDTFQSRQPMTTSPTTSACFGEADPALLHYTWRAENNPRRSVPHHIHWHSNDSDLIALYLLYHDKRSHIQQECTRILWHCEKNVVVDMCALARSCVAFFGNRLSAREIGEALVLCGTDFFSKKRTSHRKRIDAMLEAYATSASAAERRVPSLARMRMWLRHLWGTVKPKKKSLSSFSMSPLVLAIEEIRVEEEKKQRKRMQAKEKKKQKEEKEKEEAVSASASASASAAAASSPFSSSSSEDNVLEDEDVSMNDSNEEEQEEDEDMRGSAFPSDDEIVEEAVRWMWNCRYWDKAFQGHSVSEDEIYKEVQAEQALEQQRKKQSVHEQFAAMEAFSSSF